MTAPAILDAAGVAARIGLAPATVRRRWRALVAAGRLPPPINAAGHPRWRAAEIDRMTVAGGFHVPAANDAGPEPALDAGLSARLRFGAGVIA